VLQKKEHKMNTARLLQKPGFLSSPSHNASRFCRKPKERAASEGGSPHHAIRLVKAWLVQNQVVLPDFYHIYIQSGLSLYTITNMVSGNNTRQRFIFSNTDVY